MSFVRSNNLSLKYQTDITFVTNKDSIPLPWKPYIVLKGFKYFDDVMFDNLIHCIE